MITDPTSEPISGDAKLRLDSILQAYRWFDHPEGMKFVETHRDAHRTVGLWLFLPGSISAFHAVLNCEEVWLIHAGKLIVHVIDSTGAHQIYCLGSDLAAGEDPVLTVPRGAWQAAELPRGVPFAFGANVCAPAFDYSEFTLGNREELLARFPGHAEVIRRLTHPHPPAPGGSAPETR